MRRVLVAATFAFVVNSSAYAQGGVPRAIGDTALGMSESRFTEVYKVKPSRCASCYRGEHMAEVTPLDRKDFADSLEKLGLTSPNGPVVTFFFEQGHLKTIRVGELAALEGFSRATALLGPGKVVDKKEELTAREWADSRTRLRITRFGADYELIVADTVEKQGR